MKELERIQRVKAPPFLFTRIEEQIRQLESTKVKPALVWGMSLAFCALLILNVMVMTNVSDGNTTASNTMEAGFGLETSNHLYNE